MENVKYFSSSENQMSPFFHCQLLVFLKNVILTRFDRTCLPCFWPTVPRPPYSIMNILYCICIVLSTMNPIIGRFYYLTYKEVLEFKKQKDDGKYEKFLLFKTSNGSIFFTTRY